METTVDDRENLARRSFGEQVKALRKYLGESQKKFGERFGAKQQSVYAWEKGLHWPEQKQIIEDLREFIEKLPDRRPLITSFTEPYASESSPGYEPSNISQPLEERHAPVPIPIISWVQAGGWEYAADPYQPGGAEEWIESTATRSQSSFALRVRGDSMEPEFCEADVIVVDPDVEPRHNSFVIAKNGSEATFKQLVIDGDRKYLKPLNPRYPVIDGGGFRVVGVVVEKRKQYK